MLSNSIVGFGLQNENQMNQSFFVCFFPFIKGKSNYQNIHGPYYN